MNFNGHIINAYPPVADIYESGPNSTDVIDAQGSAVLFILQEGVGTTGTATLTVNACSNTTPSATTAIPFIYRTNTTSDTWSAWTAATTAGFTTTAGSNHVYQVLVDPAEIAEAGYQYVNMTMTEAVDAAVLAGVIAIVLEPRYQPQPSSLLD